MYTYKKGVNHEAVFKGLLRTTMLFGVPMQSFFIASSVIIWLSMAVSHYIIILLPIVFIVMKTAIRYDENIFKLIFFKIKFWGKRKNKEYYGANTYTTNAYRLNNKFNTMPDLSILGLDKNLNIEKLLPFSSLITKDIVKTHDYDLMTTWKVEGTAFEIEDIDILNSRIDLLNMIFKQSSTKKFSFYVHSTRATIEDSFLFKYDDPYLTEFSEQYYETFNHGSLHENNLYLTLIYSPLNSKIKRSSFKKLNVKVRRDELKHYTDEVDEMTGRIETILKEFKLSKLAVYEDNNIQYSSQLAFYSYLLSGKFKKVRVLQAPLNTYLSGGLQNIQFGKNTLQLNFPNGDKRFARMLEFKEYGTETYPGILNVFMYLNIDYTITQSFSPEQRMDAIKALNKQQNQLEGTEDAAISQIDEISIALDQLTSDEISFGKYSFSITIYADSKKKLIEDTNEAIAALTNTGFSPTLADLALPASYFAQLPGNFSYRPRVDTLSSANFASLSSFHNFPKGKRDQNCWGDAISILKTPNGQPYYLNLHETQGKNDFGKEWLGNTFIVGKSGGGKTAFLSFLLNMMMKYNNKETFPNNLDESKKRATFVYFDKDYGAMGNILAIGGKYSIIRNGEPSGFNPFMMEATKTNINHLQVLMKMLVTRNGEILTVKDEEALNNAITFIMKEVPKEDRAYPISLLCEQITQKTTDSNSLKKRFSLWTKGNKFGWVFDNENDELEFNNDTSVFGIDGTEFLDDADVKDPIAYYLNWRVFELIDGRRFGVWYDEVWYWVENEIIAKGIKDKQKTIRKRNGVMVLATQSVEDIAQSKIARPIIEQSASLIFFANQKAIKEDYINLSCTDDEFNTIKKFKPSEYKFLIKREEGAVIVQLDLSKLDNAYIKILSTGIAYKEQVEDIFSQDNITQAEKVNQLKQLYKG